MATTKKRAKKPRLRDAAEIAVMRGAVSLAKQSFGSRGTSLITSPDQEPSKEKPKVAMKRGDWVRCRQGPLRGAEGTVDQLQKISEFVTVLEVRQLNGNVIRLPRSYWEFASMRPSTEMHAE